MEYTGRVLQQSIQWVASGFELCFASQLVINKIKSEFSKQKVNIHLEFD